MRPLKAADDSTPKRGLKEPGMPTMQAPPLPAVRDAPRPQHGSDKGELGTPWAKMFGGK